MIVEKYQKIGEGEDFDLNYWQKMGAEAIFAAAYELILDYYLLKELHADQPRLQRTVENFGKL